ncbi:NmrA family transcriptional regulator [Leptospira biflexa]|uniref:NmrA family transcriptional regulator n=1 Tax=Leptospira biflexa TaxID=172 RepID=UPI0010839BD2|nr:NmrA family transcriptional regulator [Leptospira biflexa]TGM33654.1 NmrA family transcriptional regulator [Leptospira biflexa]TGM34480.1 NmrA family transcriptional regulator [Leptospira biflexa]
MKPLNLILGSSGKTGSRIVNKLNQLDVPIRLGSRKSSPSFDWQKPETWAPIISGVDHIYISYQPDLAVPNSIHDIQKLLEIANQFKVKRIVLLSGRGEPEAIACETLVENSGMEWTILRSSWFSQNFSEGMFLGQILERKVIFPKLNAREPFIDLDDLTDLAVDALVNEKHIGKRYELTGPELLSFQDAFGCIAKELNESIPFEEIPLDEYIAMLGEFGLDQKTIWLIRYLIETVLDGRNESVLNDFERGMGKKPKKFQSYVKETMESGVWNLP